ncbi:MAG: glycosyl hydrolase [Candidatus Campbellbacteria bacterium]|nr:glycosyl hydrolase [Candidatus Campbellbacteria bacterium]
MKKFVIGFFVFGVIAFLSVTVSPFEESLEKATGEDANPNAKLVPVEGKIYHAMSPDAFSGWNNISDPSIISEHEDLVGKGISWISVTNTWFPRGVANECLNGQRNFFDRGIHFPRNDVEKVVRSGNIPSIRMFPYDRCITSDYEKYKLENFIDGKFDEEIRAWAREAKSIPSPLLVTFGVEVNGFWFPWNLRYNGGLEKTEYGDPELYDGHERFRDAYRRIIDIFRDEGVQNVTWFYHVNCIWDSDIGNPEASVDGYYPGDDYIDWIGVSCYGSQNPKNDFWWDMSLTFDNVYQQITESNMISEEKPIALMEYGVTEDERKPEWMEDFFEDIVSGRYPRLKALSWWQSEFCVVYDETEDQGCAQWTDIRVNSSQEALGVYRDYMSHDVFIGEARFEER